MRKITVKGVTLIELLVVSAISGAILLLIASYVSDYIKTGISYQRMSQLQKDLPVVRKLFNRYFDRGTRLSFTQHTGGGGIAAQIAGYQVKEWGDIVIDADLRPCTTFNPATSAANLTRVVISCCNPVPRNAAMTANTPDGGTINFTSVCGNMPGLSFEEFVNNVSRTKQCIPGMEQMNIALVGTDDVRGSALLSIDFLGNTGKFKDGNLNPQFNLRTILFGALGNAGSLTVECQPPTLAY